MLLEKIKRMNRVSHQYDNTSFHKKNNYAILKDIIDELLKKAKQINCVSHHTPHDC